MDDFYLPYIRMLRGYRMVYLSGDLSLTNNFLFVALLLIYCAITAIIHSIAQRIIMLQKRQVNLQFSPNSKYSVTSNFVQDIIQMFNIEVYNE